MCKEEINLNDDECMCPDFMDTSYLVGNKIAEKASDLDFISSDVVTAYLNSIKHFEVLSPEEEKEYAIRIRKGDQDARQKFIEHNTKLVVHAAKKRANRSPLEFADLLQAGNLGLMKAVEKFDPSKGRFSTCAMYWILASMKRTEENVARPIRLPSYMVQVKNKVNRAREFLTIELGREPLIDEIVEATGCSKKSILRVLKVDYKMFSLNNMFGDEKEDEGLSFFSSEEDVEETVVNEIMSTSVAKEVRDIVSNLPKEEKQIITMKYFENCTLKKISETLGIPKQGVKDIEKKALETLKKYCEDRGLQSLLFIK